jgi:hypothetical protein
MKILLPVKDEESSALAVLKSFDSESILAVRLKETDQNGKYGLITVESEDGAYTVELAFTGEHTNKYQFVYNELFDWGDREFDRYLFVEGEDPVMGENPPLRHQGVAFVHPEAVEKYEYARIDGFDYWILSIDGEPVAALEDSLQRPMTNKIESDLEQLMEDSS